MKDKSDNAICLTLKTKKLMKPHSIALVARFTVECRKFLKPSLFFFYKTTNHKPLRTTLAPSCLFRVGKIVIYVNTDYHKLHFLFEISSGFYHLVWGLKNNFLSHVISKFIIPSTKYLVSDWPMANA